MAFTLKINGTPHEVDVDLDRSRLRSQSSVRGKSQGENFRLEPFIGRKCVAQMRERMQRPQSRLLAFPRDRRHTMLADTGFVDLRPDTAGLTTDLQEDFSAGHRRANSSSSSDGTNQPRRTVIIV